MTFMSENAADAAKRTLITSLYLVCGMMLVLVANDLISMPQSEVNLAAEFYVLGLSAAGIFATRIMEMQWCEGTKDKGWRIAHWAFLLAAVLCACGVMSSCTSAPVESEEEVDCDTIKSDSIHFTSGEEWMYGKVVDDLGREYGYWLLLDKESDTLRIDIDLYCMLFNAEHGSEPNFEVSGHVECDSLICTTSPLLTYTEEGGRGRKFLVNKIDMVARLDVK